MQMEWNFDIFSPGSSVATDGEGGSQERVDTLGKSKFSTIPHICFWLEKWIKKVLHSFLGSKKFLHGHSLDSCFTKSPWSEFNTKRGQAALSLWIHQQQNSCRHFFTQFSLSLLPLSRKCIWARRGGRADGERGENGANILGSSAPANVWRATLCPNVCECAQLLMQLEAPTHISCLPGWHRRGLALTCGRFLDKVTWKFWCVELCVNWNDWSGIYELYQGDFCCSTVSMRCVCSGIPSHPEAGLVHSILVTVQWCACASACQGRLLPACKEESSLDWTPAGKMEERNAKYSRDLIRIWANTYRGVRERHWHRREQRHRQGNTQMQKLVCRCFC